MDDRNRMMARGREPSARIEAPRWVENQSEKGTGKGRFLLVFYLEQKKRTRDMFFPKSLGTNTPIDSYRLLLERV